MKNHKTPDSAYIQSMFNQLAGRYDLFNHLVSFGMASLWRTKTLEPLRPGMRMLDLGCGTGDLALEAFRKYGSGVEIVGVDFSARMLDFARRRAEKLGVNGQGSLRFVLKKAEELPIENEPYDLVVSGFVLRNLYENIDSILKGVRRSLKEGGAVSFLDITEPENSALRFFWKIYMNTLGALYGKILFGRDYPVFYLTESARRFPRAKDFAKKLEISGFLEVRAKPFMFGIVTLYRAVK